MHLRIGLWSILILVVVPANARWQSNEMIVLLHDFEAKAARGTPQTYNDEAEHVIERFEHTNQQNFVEALPIILEAAANSDVGVRQVSAMALFALTLRPEGRALLLPHTSTLAALLIDPVIGTRKLTGFALWNLPLDSTSPLLPNLQAYLSREDAVATIGAGVACLLMRAAPDDATTTITVVHFMQRKDHDAASRADLLQSVRVAKSHNREIGRAVASYANDPNEPTSVQAIQTLQAMGSEVVSDNQQILSQIAADPSRSANIRTVATKTLSPSNASPRNNPNP